MRALTNASGLVLVSVSAAVALAMASGCQSQVDDPAVYLAGDAGAEDMEPCEKCDAGGDDNPENIPPPTGGWPWQDGGVTGGDGGGGDGGTPARDAGMSQSQYPEPIFHANCKGQCGLGCAGLAGRHYCTDACWDHDTCVRDCQAAGKWCCHCRCAGGLAAAASSVIDCYNNNGVGCECPHPKENPEN